MSFKNPFTRRARALNARVRALESHLGVYWNDGWEEYSPTADGRTDQVNVWAREVSKKLKLKNEYHNFFGRY